MKWPWRKPQAPPRLAYPLRVAALEHELLGIEPEPGTAAALIVELSVFSKFGRPAMEELLPE